MIIILLFVFAVLIAGATLLSNNNTDAVMDEYCRLECTDNKIMDYSICC